MASSQPKSDPPSISMSNFSSQVERIRTEITSSFSEMIKVLQERRDVLLQQLDSLSRNPNLFPQHSHPKEKNSNLSQLGTHSKTTPEELCELKFNLDRNLTISLQTIGLIQVTLTDSSNIQMDKKITSPRDNYTPCKVCWRGDKLFVLDDDWKRIDVLSREGELITSFPLQVEIEKDDLLCFTATNDYLLLTRQSSDIVTYYKHDGMLLPGLPYHLKNPVNMASRGDMVAIVDVNQVLLFSQYSDCVTLIGSDSSRPGRLYNPADVAFTADDCLLVLDHKSPCFHLYDQKSHYLANFGCSLIGFDITHPSCFSVDEEGVVLLVHKRSRKVTIFTPNRCLAFKLRVEARTLGYLFPTSCSVQGNLLAISYGDNHMTGICDITGLKNTFIQPHK